MIVFESKNIFEAKFPKLEDHEEEVFFQHPVEDIKCNQLGALYYEDGDYVIYDKGDTTIIRRRKVGNYSKNIGSKLRVIWECYTGKITTGPHFLFVNGNPLDTRFENLRKISDLNRKGKEWTDLHSVKKKFVQNSVDRLLKIEARADRLGMDKDQLYQILMLPYWLMSARQRAVDPPVRTTRFSTTKRHTTEEEADEVEKFFHQGLTYYAIVKTMGWASTNRVKKVVRDRGLSR